MVFWNAHSAFFVFLLLCPCFFLESGLFIPFQSMLGSLLILARNCILGLVFFRTFLSSPYIQLCVRCSYCGSFSCWVIIFCMNTFLLIPLTPVFCTKYSGLVFMSFSRFARCLRSTFFSPPPMALYCGCQFFGFLSSRLNFFSLLALVDFPIV